MIQESEDNWNVKILSKQNTSKQTLETDIRDANFLSTAYYCQLYVVQLVWCSYSTCCSGSGQGAQLGVSPPQGWPGSASGHPEACSISDHQCVQAGDINTTCSTISRGSSWTCWHRWVSCPTTSPPCQGRPTAEKMSQPPAPPATPD